jgi:hypothetical protein
MTHVCNSKKKITLTFVIYTLMAVASVEAATVDLVYVFDSSGSVGGAGFLNEKAAATFMTNSFTLGPSAFAIGGVKFASTAVTEFTLSTSAVSVNSSISAMSFISGSADIWAGLDQAGALLSSAGRTGATQAIVLFSDGLNGSNPATLASANLLKANGIHIFAVGVGPFMNISELVIIAGDPTRVIDVQNLTSGWAAQIAALPAVPIPPAVWLFGSALGLLGWMRRRKTA